MCGRICCTWDFQGIAAGVGVCEWHSRWWMSRNCCTWKVKLWQGGRKYEGGRVRSLILRMLAHTPAGRLAVHSTQHRWQSGQCVGLEIQWGSPAQVRILSDATVFVFAQAVGIFPRLLGVGCVRSLLSIVPSLGNKSFDGSIPAAECPRISLFAQVCLHTCSPAQWE